MVDWDSELALLVRPTPTEAQEIYITYGRDGERVLTTTGEQVWRTAYQRSGSKAWETLGNPVVTANGSPGTNGDRIANAARRIRPRWHTDTIEFDPAVYVADSGDNAGDRSNGREGTSPQVSGIGPAGPANETWDSIDGGGLSERTRIRSHRHCPGCSGHARVYRGNFNLIGRMLLAWIISYAGVSWFYDWDVNPIKYAIGSVFVLYAAQWFRPVWRELGSDHQNVGKVGGRT